MNEYIPLLMLIGFSGLLLGFGILAAKGIERERKNRRDEIEQHR